MLINMNEALNRQHHLVAFNFFNLETLAGILDAARSQDRIVIAAFGEGYLDHMPLSAAAALVRSLSDERGLDVVLHLDHAGDLEVIREAVRLGFTSVMYDGSKLPLAENIARTRAVVELASAAGASVEGELGYLNKEDGSDAVEIVYTEVADALRFVRETGVDALAIAVGNAHGLYRETPRINLQRIEEISAATGIPLVLHGSSGIARETLEQAFAGGIRKINVNTDLVLAASEAARVYLLSHQSARFEQVMTASRQAVARVCGDFLTI